MLEYVRYGVYKSPPLVAVISQINPLHLMSCFSNILSVLSFQVSLRHPRGLFCSGFATKAVYIFFFSPYSAYLMLLDSVIAMMFGEQFKSLPKFCNFRHPSLENSLFSLAAKNFSISVEMFNLPDFTILTEQRTLLSRND
jgi:hypothetical protein